jgi:hypothetical protein
MHFSVIFETYRGQGFNQTHTLDFVPSPCWMKGEEVYINLNPKSPYYADVIGGCKTLMKAEGLSLPLRATVVVLVEGNGVEADLLALVEDIKSCGIEVEVLRSGFSELPWKRSMQ